MSMPDSVEPPRIVTDWRRFSCGLWRVPRGDISDAYSADRMPRVGVFSHEGRLFTNCGCAYAKLIHAVVDAHPLIHPDEYRGPEAARRSYEGSKVMYKGKPYRLGPRVHFSASDPSVAEWQRLLRCMFADGGMFALGCAYPEFLTGRIAPESAHSQTAVVRELAACESGELPREKNAMLSWLDGGAKPFQPAQQLGLGI
jgi:hypothetical protein